MPPALVSKMILRRHGVRPSPDHLRLDLDDFLDGDRERQGRAWRVVGNDLQSSIRVIDETGVFCPVEVRATHPEIQDPAIRHSAGRDRIAHRLLGDLSMDGGGRILLGFFALVVRRPFLFQRRIVEAGRADGYALPILHHLGVIRVKGVVRFLGEGWIKGSGHKSVHFSHFICMMCSTSSLLSFSSSRRVLSARRGAAQARGSLCSKSNPCRNTHPRYSSTESSETIP